MNNKEIIKEYREKFPRQRAHTKELEDWLWAEKQDIAQFWLSKLKEQKEQHKNIIKGMEEHTPVGKANASTRWIEYGANQAIKEIIKAIDKE